MLVTDSVLDNLFVARVAPAKPTAHNAAAMVALFISEVSGLDTIRIPMKPVMQTRIRVVVQRSPRTSGASAATHKGVVNSNANSCERGIRGTA